MTGPDDRGAAAERRRRRKWLGLLGLAVAWGMATGLGFTLTKDDVGAGGGAFSPPVAIAAAAAYLALMLFGSYAMTRVTDEIEIHNNVWGLAAGGGVLLLAYPPWWMLWRGGLIGEPTHDMLFLMMFGTALLVYAWKKYR